MRSIREAARRHAGLAFSVLPRGRMLPDEVWQRRHRAIVRVAALQALALVLFGAFSAQGVLTSLAGGLLVAAPLLLALPPSSSRKLRSEATSVSLFLASTVLVQFWSG